MIQLTSGWGWFHSHPFFTEIYKEKTKWQDHENRDWIIFPMDVNFFSGKEIHIIQDQYGADGISFYVYLLCNIFKNGYYLQLDADFFRNIFFNLEIDQERAMSILGFFLEESLFDMGLF